MKPLTIFLFVLANASASAQLTCPCELDYEDPWALPTNMNMTSSTDATNPLENTSNLDLHTTPKFSYPQWYQEQQSPTPLPTPTPLLVSITYDVPQNVDNSTELVSESKPTTTIPYYSQKTKRKSRLIKHIKRKVKSVKYSGKCPKF